MKKLCFLLIDKRLNWGVIKDGFEIGKTVVEIE